MTESGEAASSRFDSAKEHVENTMRVSSSCLSFDSVFELLPYSSSQCFHNITGGGSASRASGFV